MTRKNKKPTPCGHFTICSILCGFWRLVAASTRQPVSSLRNIANCSREILHAPSTERDQAYIEAIVDQLVRRGRVLHLIHLIGRVIRNLAIDELIIAGDCWDRGPRGDHVVEYLMQQPNVSFVWGNHDVAWLGACLGHEALICHVMRISIRYRRLLQLEEGYGIPIEPLDLLARTVYADDPATSFEVKGTGMRENGHDGDGCRKPRR